MSTIDAPDVMPFGQYAGLDYGELVIEDPRHARWMVEQHSYPSVKVYYIHLSPPPLDSRGWIPPSPPSFAQRLPNTALNGCLRR